jgi:hypothetical protein
MTRWLPILALALFPLAACSTSKPTPPPPAVDPVTDPSIVGTVGEAVIQGSIEGAAAAETGRRIGRVAGVIAAVLGGPESESVDDMIDRYRDTRDAVTVTSAVIGAINGGVAGAKRGFELDLQCAELHRIAGVEVLRPFPDLIDVHFTTSPNPQLLADIAAVFAGREERAIVIEAAGNEAFDIRESLIELGLPASRLAAYRNDELRQAVMRIGYVD